MRSALVALGAVVMVAACGGAAGTTSNTPAAPSGTIVVDIRTADVVATVPPVPSPSAAAAPSPVVAQPMTMTFLVGAGTAGKYKDQDGMTLYTYTNDAFGRVTCVAQCAVAWPPLLLTSGTPASRTALTGKLGTIDGPLGRQVTYNGWPLYFWKSDSKPGDTLGQYVNKVWFAATA
jgi:predicted lipoprotein with Yx(FWY)xxD motif